MVYALQKCQPILKKAAIMIQTRALQLHDYNDWLTLWQQYLQTRQANLSHDTTLNTWKYILSNDETNLIGLGVYANNKLQGFAHLVFHHNTWDARDCCYLEDLHVHAANESEDLQLEKALIVATTLLAQERNCCRVYWHASSKHHRANHDLYNELAQQTDFIKFTIHL